MQHVYHFPTTATSEPWTPPPASAGHKGRYLWTDAFGVLNFLTLHQETSNPIFLSHALALIPSVHNVLGRTRDGSSPLPHATDQAPLAGGLRIGKESATGPDADGQYHHYLTLWMFALNRAALAAQDPGYNTMAIQLARAIHPYFVKERESARPRMVWKTGVDLNEVMVGSEGNLDPFDGYAVCRLLTGEVADGVGGEGALDAEIGDYSRIVRAKFPKFSSGDSLDQGMALWTAHWYADEDWAAAIIHAVTEELKVSTVRGPMSHRLAFREFGECLGIKCALMGAKKWDERAEDILEEWEVAGAVPSPKNGAAGMNTEESLQPITCVMYAAALIPGVFHKGYLIRFP
ncbi:hypothetical protein EJ06DRAFT_527492 [Trichodelitschia bisporula]|uniref:Six-hairpin glycosidase n=1 Tax=Trichodelitschia bisporula TaxID=703511 RepID=A0A6G1I6I9_9PEZI|nr:hypothetical protein EJ06DRAFT_527492 [Trichodelitschia bisporula]